MDTVAHLDMLRQTFDTKQRKLALTLFWRDLREGLGGLFLVIYFARRGWQHGWAYWPYALGILLILGVTVFFLRERVRARRLRLGPDATLLAKIDADIAELRHQHRLLLNIAQWYLAPLMAAWAIVLATDLFNQPERMQGRSHQLFLVGYLVICALLTWGIWGLNRSAACTKIAPRLADLELLRADLLSSK